MLIAGNHARPPPLAVVQVNIRHVKWRNGRPRFEPGPKVRALGFHGEDLRHGEAGAWFTLDEVQTWLSPKLAEIDTRRKRKAEGKRPQPIRRPGVYSVEALFEDVWRLQKYRLPTADCRLPNPRSEGDRGRAAPKTIEDYKKKARLLGEFDPELYTSDARALTRPIVLNLHERLWHAKGLSMANAMVAVLRLAFSEAINRGWPKGAPIAQNPCTKLKLPTPRPRLRVGTPAELDALMRAADAYDPEIGDAIVLALYTLQREGDVLALAERNAADGVIRFIQSKTSARVKVRAIPQLQARLAAARRRKELHNCTEIAAVCFDRRTRASFNEHSFRHRYAEVRAIAAKEKDCASVASLWFADMRDTGITRCALAGCTLPEIAALSGHSLETINTILKHYLELNEAHADAACDKLTAWMEKEGIRV
jgi:integrase